METFNFNFLSINGWGIDLDCSAIEWFALETDHFVFEFALKYCISDSSVDYEGYFIFPKEFLPTLIDIMVI